MLVGKIFVAVMKFDSRTPDFGTDWRYRRLSPSLAQCANDQAETLTNSRRGGDCSDDNRLQSTLSAGEAEKAAVRKGQMIGSYD